MREEQTQHRDALFAFLVVLIMLTALLNQTALGVIADARNVSATVGGATPSPGVARREVANDAARLRLQALHDDDARRAGMMMPAKRA